MLTEVFHIKHVRISPYHAMGNQVERLHSTLNRCAINKSPEKWVDILPLVMFAYLEVPNESTGFSPIELMFGSVARGALTLIKEDWTGTESINCNKRNVVEYLLDLRQSLADTVEVANATEISCTPNQRSGMTKSHAPGYSIHGSLYLCLHPYRDPVLTLSTKVRTKS